MSALCVHFFSVLISSFQRVLSEERSLSGAGQALLEQRRRQQQGAGLVLGPPRKAVCCMGGWEAGLVPRESVRSQHLSLQQQSDNWKFCSSWEPPAADEGHSFLLASKPTAGRMAELKEAGAAQETSILDTGTLERAHLPHCGSCKDIKRKTWSSYGNRRTGRAELGRGKRRNSRRGAPLPTAGPQISATKRGQRRAALTHKAATGAQFPMNAARERSRVRTLHQAFLALQAALPTVPPDTKLSKLDVLLLATSYIAHLSQTLEQGPPIPRMSPAAFLHPLKKWPMRSCLYVSSWTGGIPVPTLFGGWPQPSPETRGTTL